MPTSALSHPLRPRITPLTPINDVPHPARAARNGQACSPHEAQLRRQHLFNIVTGRGRQSSREPSRPELPLEVRCPMTDILRLLLCEDASFRGRGLPPLVVSPIAKRIVSTVMVLLQRRQASLTCRAQQDVLAGNPHVLLFAAFYTVVRLADENGALHHYHVWLELIGQLGAKVRHDVELLRALGVKPCDGVGRKLLMALERQFLRDIEHAAYVNSDELEQAGNGLNVWLKDPALALELRPDGNLNASYFTAVLVDFIRLEVQGMADLKLGPKMRAIAPASPQTPVMPITPPASRIYGSVLRAVENKGAVPNDRMTLRPRAMPPGLARDQRALAAQVAPRRR